MVCWQIEVLIRIIQQSLHYQRYFYIAVVDSRRCSELMDRLQYITGNYHQFVVIFPNVDLKKRTYAADKGSDEHTGSRLCATFPSICASTSVLEGHVSHVSSAINSFEPLIEHISRLEVASNPSLTAVLPGKHIRGYVELLYFKDMGR